MTHSMFGRLGSVPVVLAAALLALACGDGAQQEQGAVTGDDDVTMGDDDVSDDETAPGPVVVDEVTGCESPSPGAAPMRRLSNAEYRNTLVDLLGDEALVERVSSVLPQEPVSLGFRNGADTLRVNELLADQYLQAAFELSLSVPDVPDLVPCSVDTFDHECAEAFIRDFGKRVYRRRLQDPEVQRYADLYQAAIDEGSDFRTSLEWLSAALLSSSNFLFRVELSSPTTGTVIRPSGYEMASRLSYLLWQTMPDDALFAAAEDGSLETADGIEAQVLRMVQDPKALRVYEFFEQWLDLDEMEGISRNPEVYPEANSALLQLFKAENRAFVYAILTESGTFADLVSAPYTYANSTLAMHYGLADVPAGSTFERVDAPGRAGILTQGMLTVQDGPTRTSIVRRGLKIRTDLFCQLVPAPPDTVDLTLPELDGEVTQRERLEQHRQEASCAACHSLMDPIGEMFDGFDALGRIRATDEAGAPVSTNGEVVATTELDGQYAGVTDFAQAMAESDLVRDCFVRQAFRFFYGREATEADECTQQQLMQTFARRDYRVVDLIMGLTQSDQFLYRGQENAQ